MHREHKAVLDKFLTIAANSAISVVLVGSHTLGNPQENSDIDLIVLTRSPQEAETVRHAANELNRFKPRPVIDCKVYTETEFSRAKAGSENRFLWTCMINGKVLSGEDITNAVQLEPQCVSDSYWKHVQSVENACGKLGYGVHYTGSCFFLYDTLSTTYFVDRFIFRLIEDSISKDDFVRSKLGSEFLRARERYYWIVRRIGPRESQSRLRVPTSVDRSFKRSDYERMHEKALDVLEIVQDKYKELKKWSEST